MKKIYSLIFACTLFVMNLKAQSFSVGTPGYDYTLTCLNPVITMTANSGNVPYSYTWTSTSGTYTGNYINITQPGLWACTGTNLNTNSVTAQVSFTIYQNMQSPTVVVTPTINNTTCAGGSGCFTMTSNLGPNVTTNWFIMNGSSKIYVGASQGTINIFCAGHPGVYWGESVSNDNGCAGTKSVLVTASVGVPVFTVTSPTNFILGCSNASVTSIQVTSVITSPVPNVPTNYTFMLPPVTSTPTTFNSTSNLNNITVSGIYVVYVRDQTNNCVSSQSINVIQNTVTPNAYHMLPVPLLSCYEPSMAITTITTNTNTTFYWIIPTIPMPQTLFTQTIQANINPAVAGATSNITSAGTYSLYAYGTNSCISITTIQVIQDIRKPIFTITALTNSVVSCSNPTVMILPVITPTLAVALVPTYAWFPPPVGSYTGTQYVTTVPGSHSATSMSSVNGCTYSTNYNVASDNSIGAFGGNVYVSCPITTAVVSPTFTANQTTMTFTWSGPPGSITSPTNQSTIVVNTIGVYTCAVTNISNSCTYTIYCSVECINGIIDQVKNNSSVLIFPNPSSGVLNVELSSVETGLSILIYDLQGKVLMEKPLNEVNNRLYINLPKGCYFYKISSEKAVLRRDKLIIE